MSSSLWKAHFKLTNLKNPPLPRPNEIVDIAIDFIGKKIFKENKYMIANLEFNYSNTTIIMTLTKIVNLVWNQVTWGNK